MPSRVWQWKTPHEPHIHIHTKFEMNIFISLSLHSSHFSASKNGAKDQSGTEDGKAWKHFIILQINTTLYRYTYTTLGDPADCVRVCSLTPYRAAFHHNAAAPTHWPHQNPSNVNELAFSENVSHLYTQKLLTLSNCKCHIFIRFHSLALAKVDACQCCVRETFKRMCGCVVQCSLPYK